MTSKSFVLAACLIALGASTGTSYAASAIHVRSDRTERPSWQPQMQPGTSDAFAAMQLDAPQHNAWVYHGGPKFNY